MVGLGAGEGRGIAGELGAAVYVTGNDFARAVGIPLDPRDAARPILEGVPRPLDLLVDDAGGSP